MPGTVGMQWSAKGCRRVYCGMRRELSRMCDQSRMAFFPLHSVSDSSSSPYVE